jgi:hypothetical protein
VLDYYRGWLAGCDMTSRDDGRHQRAAKIQFTRIARSLERIIRGKTVAPESHSATGLGWDYFPQCRLSHEASAQASALAGEVVDQLTDSIAPEEEQQKRKRKLIHGPREFGTCARISTIRTLGPEDG